MLDLRTHRILRGDKGGSGVLVQVSVLSCVLKLEGLVGTPECPGTSNGIVQIVLEVS
jgi:hypothetical protein